MPTTFFLPVYADSSTTTVSRVAISIPNVGTAGTQNADASTIQGHPSGLPVNVAIVSGGSSTLPTNASTASAQAGMQTSLTSIDSKIVAGAALAANQVPGTAPGTAATLAMGVQGVPNGIAQNVAVTSLPQTTALAYGSLTLTAANTAYQLPANANLTSGVRLKSKAANTAIVAFGGNNTVTAATGTEIAVGLGDFVPCSNSSQVWVISATPGQVINWNAI